MDKINIKQKRVLILEDDEMVRLIVKDYLRVSGFEVLESADPLSAIDMLKNDACDLAIVDINIPQMSGEEFIAKAKNLCPHIQIIIHTGTMDYKVTSKMQELGVSQDSVLEKPVEDMNTFVSLINRLVQDD